MLYIWQLHNVDADAETKRQVDIHAGPARLAACSVPTGTAQLAACSEFTLPGAQQHHWQQEDEEKEERQEGEEEE